MNFKNYLFYYSICFYIAILTIVPSNYKIHGVAISDCFFMVLICLYLGILITKSDSRKRFTAGLRDFFTDKLGISMVALGIIMMYSVTYSLEKGLAITESVRYISYVILFFIIKYECSDKKLTNMVIKCYFYIGAALGVLGIFQYFFGFNESKFIANYKFGARERITATMGNPNQYVAFLIMIIFPLIMVSIFESNKRNKIIFFIIDFIIIINIGLTFSRNGYIAFFIGCVALVVIYNLKFIIFVLIAAVSAFIIPQTSKRILELGDKSQNFTRINLWKTAIKMFEEHPLRGVGNGNFVSYYDAYVKKYPKELYIYYDYQRYPAHNSYLKVLSELGVIGIIPFILIIIFSFLNLIKFITNRKNDVYKFIGMGIIASISAFLFMNLFENLFFVPSVTACFWVFLALEGSITYWEKVQ